MLIPGDNPIHVAELGWTIMPRVSDGEIPGADCCLADDGLRDLIPSLHLVEQLKIADLWVVKRQP